MVVVELVAVQLDRFVDVVDGVVASGVGDLGGGSGYAVFQAADLFGPGC